MPVFSGESASCVAIGAMERRRLRELLARAPAGIGLLSGPEHRWTYVNDLYVQITGRSNASDFLGKTIRESLPEIEGQGFLELLDGVYASGEPYVGREARAILNRAHGGLPEEAYFNFVYQPIRDSAGGTEGVLVHAVEVTDHVLARRVIEMNEERLRLAQESAQIGTWEWEPGQKSPNLSVELLRIFGLDPGDPDHARTWTSRVDPGDWEMVTRCMEEGYRSGAMDFEYRYAHPHLGLRWLCCKGSRHPGRTQMFGVVMDITERKHTEEALRQREVEFRGLADAMPQLAWMAHPNGDMFWYNRGWFEYTGATAAEMEGWGWQSAHDPAVLPKVLDRWKHSIETGQPFEMTFPLRGADGQFRPFLTRAVPVRDASGHITRWFGTSTDVGPEVAIRQELEKSQARLEAALIASQRLAAIVDSSDDAIVSKDLNGIVTSWNPGAERMFGYSAEEMIGRSIKIIIPTELYDDEERFLAAIARGERIEHFETHRRTKDGKRIEVSLTLSPVRDDSGKIVGAAKIARDITQRKQAERALHINERLASVGRLASTIAHEINNPLEGIMNLVYLARENTLESETRLLLEHTEQELGRVSLLTKQTLGLYRDTRGLVTERLSEIAFRPKFSSSSQTC
jgi:PAS domain S-box-containing protein